MSHPSKAFAELSDAELLRAQLLDVLSLYLRLRGPERASVRIPHAPGAAENTLIVTAPTGLVVYGWSRGPSPAVGSTCAASSAAPAERFADLASLRAVW
jgi:hypothetical protein